MSETARESRESNESEPRQDAQREGSPHRLFGLADGVFAISMTLLALDVRMPDSVRDTPAGYGAAARSFYGDYGVFFIAFMITGRFWISHHRIMARVRRVDRAVMERTVLFLAGISSLPVATSVLFRFGSVPQAVAFSSALLAITSLLAGRLWWYVSDPVRALSDIAPQIRRSVMIQQLFTGAVFLLAIPIAYLLAWSRLGEQKLVGYSMLIWLLLVFDGAFTRLVLRLRGRR